MKNRTYRNMIRTCNAIMAKGYDRKTANEIALKYWDNFELFGVTVECQLARLIPCEQYEAERRKRT